LNNEHNLKNEGKECKTGPIREKVVMGGERCILSMYFIYKYEDRTPKPVTIILSRGREMRENENDGGDEPNQGTLLGIYGNVTAKLPIQLLYTNKICF
jgi:hypothetical protein